MQNAERPGDSRAYEGNEFRHSNTNRTHRRRQVNPTPGDRTPIARAPLKAPTQLAAKSDAAEDRRSIMAAASFQAVRASTTGGRDCSASRTHTGRASHGQTSEAPLEMGCLQTS